MEDRFTELIHYFEGSQSRMREEQNKKLEDCAKGQNDLKTAITVLMTEVKNISNKVMGNNGENPLTQSPEFQSVVEQI